MRWLFIVVFLVGCGNDPPPTADCSEAFPGERCAVDGVSCIAEMCGFDNCTYCEFLQCTDGEWRWWERFQMCFDCDGSQCNYLSEYCDLRGASAECGAMPTGCDACDCLEAEVGGTCSETGNGLTIE